MSTTMYVFLQRNKKNIIRVPPLIWNYVFFFVVSLFIMPPTSKKLEGHIASGLFVRPSFRPSVCPSVRHAF